jgi:hypothetical protein
MTARTVTPAQLRAYVDRAREAKYDVVGFHAAPVWEHDGSLGDDVVVAACPSTLAVRAAVWDHLAADDGRLLVLLTEVQEIGSEIMARLYRGQLLRPESFEILKDLFRVTEIARELRDHQWLADLLVDVAPVGRTFAPPPGGVLDLDTAWRALLLHGLALSDADPSFRDLLAWAASPASTPALARFGDQAVSHIQQQLSLAHGPAAGWLVHLIRGGDAGDAVPLGLIAAAAVATGVTADHVTIARTHLGLRTGGGQPDVIALRSWGADATALTRAAASDPDPTAFQTWTARATKLLTEFGIPALVAHSSVLPAGFDARLEQVGHAATALIASPSARALDQVTAAVRQVRTHIDADRLVDRRRTAEMVLRLCRRLVSPPASDPPADLAEAAASYIADGAWVDDARQALLGGDPVDSLGSATHALLSRLAEQRAEEDHRFANALAGWTTVAPSGTGSLIPIESVLDRVAAPVVAAGTPVMVLLLDGLSWAQAHRMFDDIARRRFRRIAAGGSWGPVVSTLPSVTQCSRSSLFVGRPVAGGQDVEREGFAHHPGLLDATKGVAPMLFHKAALSAQDGQPAPEVRTELTDPSVPVVGVVVNGADDHLGSGGQLRLADGLRAIAPLTQLLDWAVEADRAVIVVADHGHIREIGSTVRPLHGGGERWRPADGAPAEDEVLLEGPRVVRGDGRIIAPATEAIRYNATKKVGYHGGATPQEVLCPLAVFVPGPVEIDGWLPELPQTPEWWDGQASAAVAPLPVAAPPPVDTKGVPTLFGADNEVASASQPSTSAVPQWVAELVDSPLFSQQRSAAGRQTLDRETVVGLLAELDRAGGTLTGDAFAKAVGSTTRARGKATALASLLNVDGYAAITIDGSGEVTLNRGVLREQFGIST